jgi:hypothetical protein
LNGVTLDDVKNIPFAINDHGTYQQALELTGTGVIDFNINPPGQSGFTSLNGTQSSHMHDQWPLHVAWEFKDQLFGETVVQVAQDIMPVNFKLHAPYPNPFNPVTNIKFSLNRNARIQIDIIDITGRVVDNLVDNEYDAGKHTIPWITYSVPSGVYFVRLSSFDITETKKILLLK